MRTGWRCRNGRGGDREGQETKKSTRMHSAEMKQRRLVRGCCFSGNILSTGCGSPFYTSPRNPQHRPGPSVLPTCSETRIALHLLCVNDAQANEWYSWRCSLARCRKMSSQQAWRKEPTHPVPFSNKMNLQKHEATRASGQYTGLPLGCRRGNYARPSHIRAVVLEWSSVP